MILTCQYDILGQPVPQSADIIKQNMPPLTLHVPGMKIFVLYNLPGSTRSSTVFRPLTPVEYFLSWLYRPAFHSI